jgi:Zn-dependent protease
LFAEPGQTQADLHFSVLGIPVRVHPMFWLVTAILGSAGSNTSAQRLLSWVAAVFLSILIHELGHALAFRRFGFEPWITLYGMGGLASSNARRLDPRTDIAISLAGPAAGFVLAAVIVGLMGLGGHPVRFLFGWPEIVHWRFDSIFNLRLVTLVHDLLFVNIWWGLVNLLPIYPLDGGRVARSVFELSDSRDALRKSLWLSVITAGAVAAYGLSQRDYYLLLFFGYLAYQSYMLLEGMFGRGGGFGGGGFGGGGFGGRR